MRNEVIFPKAERINAFPTDGTQNIQQGDKMPELPEVETIKRELEEIIIDKEINQVKVHLPRAFENKNNIDISGKIESISRIGKYLLINIKDKCTLIIHLRMTGKLIYLENGENLPQKHVSVILYFKENDCLIFRDIRTFGKIEVLPYKTELSTIKKIGLDALCEKFTFIYFSAICETKQIPIKNLLLDQTLIAGIGNIYAQEILFYAKISPERLANSLNKTELKRIYKYISIILNLAIQHNGTSISDFRRVDDKTGEFQNFLKVYGKKVCTACGRDLCKIKLGGRGTTYCSYCQR